MYRSCDICACTHLSTGLQPSADFSSFLVHACSLGTQKSDHKLSIIVFSSFTVDTHSSRLCAHRFLMSERDAKYPEDNQRSAERRCNEPHVTRDSECEQHDLYA